VPNVDRLQVVRECYRAYETGDEDMLARTEVYFGWNVE
jgi:hypothetical protein